MRNRGLRPAISHLSAAKWERGRLFVCFRAQDPYSEGWRGAQRAGHAGSIFRARSGVTHELFQAENDRTACRIARCAARRRIRAAAFIRNVLRSKPIGSCGQLARRPRRRKASSWRQSSPGSNGPSRAPAASGWFRHAARCASAGSPFRKRSAECAAGSGLLTHLFLRSDGGYGSCGDCHS